MWCECGVDQWIGVLLVVQFIGFGEVFVIGFGLGGGEIDDDCVNQCVEIVFFVDRGLYVVEEVVFVGIGGVVVQYFGDGQGGVVGDEFRIDYCCFYWLDVLLQLGYQWQVVGDVVQQGYWVVCMCVDQVWYQC